MENERFFEVPLPTYSESECSPNLAAGFSGLRINMPSEVSLTSMDRIPVCGAYRVSSKFEALFESNLIKHTVIVFTEINTNKAFSFNLVPHKKPMKRPAKPSGTPNFNRETEIGDEYTAESFFNIDVLKFYPSFPRKKASYTVFATNRDLKSNVIEITIID